MEEKKPNIILKRERELRGWSQRMVAEQIGTNPQTVTRWELEEHKPSRYFQVKLCELFGKNAEELGFIDELSLSNRDTKPEEAFSSSSKENNELQKPSSFLSAYSTISSESEVESVELTIQQDGRSQALPTRRDALEIIGTTTASLATPELFGTETLREFARVLSKPSTLEHLLSGLPLPQQETKIPSFRKRKGMLDREEFQTALQTIETQYASGMGYEALAMIAARLQALHNEVLYQTDEGARSIKRLVYEYQMVAGNILRDQFRVAEAEKHLDKAVLVAKNNALHEQFVAALLRQRPGYGKTIHLWTEVIEQSKALQSEWGFNEAVTTYELMEAVWPHEPRIAELHDLIIHWEE